MAAASPRRQTGGVTLTTNVADLTDVAGTAGSAAPLRVFVVEDSPLVCERLEAMIAHSGAEPVGHAGEAATAIPAILKARPEMVILDVQLPDASGFDVLRAVHAQAPEIDVYMMSNFSATPYRALANRLGARDFFDKSSEFGRMRAVIERRVALMH
jgi:DNA-binding NarL/FixJ family response regulator